MHRHHNGLKTALLFAALFGILLAGTAVLTIAFVVLLHFSTFGRGIYEIGLNDEAAHFTGVDIAQRFPRLEVEA